MKLHSLGVHKFRKRFTNLDAHKWSFVCFTNPFSDAEFSKILTHRAELITVGQPTEGQVSISWGKRVCPLSSQTQCHNSALSVPLRPNMFGSIYLCKQMFSVMSFNNHLTGPPDRQEEVSYFYLFFKDVCCLTTMYYFSNSFHIVTAFVFKLVITVKSLQSN